MDVLRCRDDDGDMSQTDQSAGAAGPEPGFDAPFDPARLRTVLALRRPLDDRMVAGVCSGLARYLRLDPVVVRVVLASLTVVGGLGVVLYATVWLLTPDEGSVRAPVGRVDAPHHSTARTTVLLVAALLGLGALVEAGSWGGAGLLWWAPWPALVVLGVVAWLLIRERGEVGAPVAPDGDPAPEPPVGETTPLPASPTTTVPLPDQPPQLPPQPPDSTPRPVSAETLRRRDGGRLLLLTAGLVTIALAGTWVADRFVGGIEAPVAVAVALGVVGVALLVGTWFGNGRPLVLPALLLGGLLAASSLVPDLSMGERRVLATDAADVADAYELGVGRQVVDLTGIDDLEALDGRTVRVETGVGETVVQVPDGLDIDVVADVDLGEVLVLDREMDGTDNVVTYSDADTGAPDLTLLLETQVGRIEVDR